MEHGVTDDVEQNSKRILELISQLHLISSLSSPLNEYELWISRLLDLVFEFSSSSSSHETSLSLEFGKALEAFLCLFSSSSSSLSPLFKLKFVSELNLRFQKEKEEILDRAFHLLFGSLLIRNEGEGKRLLEFLPFLCSLSISLNASAILEIYARWARSKVGSSHSSASSFQKTISPSFQLQPPLLPLNIVSIFPGSCCNILSASLSHTEVDLGSLWNELLFSVSRTSPSLSFIHPHHPLFFPIFPLCFLLSFLFSSSLLPL
jgi:hypothetical protein